MGGSGLRQKPPTDRAFSVRKEDRHEWSGRQVRRAISRETMLDLFRRGEVLPEGRTNEEEVKLLATATAVSAVESGGGL